MTAAKRHSIVNQPWFTNSVLALLGLWLIGLCRQGVLEIGHFIIGFGLVAMYQALGYATVAMQMNKRIATD